VETEALVAVPASQGQLREAVSLLERGGLVAYPTDTVYGLGAHAFNPGAVGRVFQVKGRSAGAPLPLLLADVLYLPWVARGLSELAWRLALTFWPGALTLVLPRTPEVPAAVCAGGDTVAVRVPRHPVPRALVRLLGAPITGTSANLSGQPSPVTPAAVRAQLEGRVDLVIEGECLEGRESTVVAVVGRHARLVREGAIPWAAIQEVCRQVPPLWSQDNPGEMAPFEAAPPERQAL